jgi:DNA polymerase-3 subunit epsilon
VIGATHLDAQVEKIRRIQTSHHTLMRQIFLYIETTGLRSEDGHRIIEIGCVELLNRMPTGSNKHYYINPGRDSDEDAIRVHGLSNEFLCEKPKFDEIADDFLSYCAGAEIFIHNAPFELSFIKKELKRLGKPAFKKGVASITDTLVIAKAIFPGQRNSLTALCLRLEIDNSSESLHGALRQADLNARIYIQLKQQKVGINL